MNIKDIPDAVLAGMVRDGCYAQGESFGKGANKYLLVLAVPYGECDTVETLPEAMEAFRELLEADDWVERNIMVYDATTDTHQVYEAAYEELADADDDDEEEEDDDDTGILEEGTLV